LSAKGSQGQAKELVVGTFLFTIFA
jgi:hypothetical protein